MLSGNYKRDIARMLIIGLTVLSSVASFSVLALGAWDIQRVKFGHVLARGLVLDDAGYPTYIEYSEDGTKVGGWSQSLADAEGAYVLSTEQVNNTLAKLSELKSLHKNKLIIMTLEQYQSQTFTTKMNKTLPKLSLSSTYKSVVVKPTESILHENDTHVVLLSLFDLNAISSANTNTKSLLFDRAGRLLHASSYNIAFDSAFFEGEGGDDVIPTVLKSVRNNKAYAPVQGAEVEVWIDGYSSTKDDGSYAAHYNIVPCPGFSFFYDNVPVIMKYYYSGFTSRGKRPLFDAMMVQGNDFCSGYDAINPTDLVGQMAKVSIIGIYAAASTAVQPINFYIDTGFISGLGYLAGIGATTEYEYSAPDLDPKSQPFYDFDGDQKYDTVFMGDLVDGQFVCREDTSTAQYQGVFFSSIHEEGAIFGNCADDEPEVTQPDVLRLADHMPDFSDQGLVSQISQQDLQDTDILVFRESTGMLITQRKGMNENELSKNRSYYGVEDGAFAFQMMIRGPSVSAFSLFANDRGPTGFSNFQSNANMNPALHKRESDHLKPGEALKVVLINRKTGYIGTHRTTYINGYKGGSVSFPMNVINMYPPNLKISAERHFTIKEGMSATNDNQTNLIAYEGSAMSDDEIITITTEWYDNDGTPLPDGMNDFGYTGRLAKVAGPGVLVSDGGSIDNFAIRPGKHIEHIRLKDMGNPADHFYIQVNGQSKYDNPSFANGGAAQSGPLAQRPKHYVPFRVPVLDESSTLEQEYIYKKLVADGLADGIDNPKPIYHWVYRPELQFSTYDLKVDDIIRQRSDDLTSSIYQDNIPMIGSSDNMVNFLYDLIESNEQALAFLGAGQELVFSLGETELKATMGDGNQLIFSNLEHIASLDVEDFVTLSLYNNNDPTNVLWEYAFESVAVDTRWVGYDNIGDDGTIYVSADEPVVPVQAILLGYANRENKKPISMKWAVKGQGIVENKDLSFKDQGVFPADIRMSTIAGSRATPEAYIDNPDNVAKLNSIEVIPGKPASIHVEMIGEAFIEGHKGIQVSVQAWDAHGNTVADGTAINFALDGNAVFALSDDGTVGGHATAFIQGASMPDDEAKLLVNVGDVSKTLEFVVQPLNVVISDYPSQLETQTSYPITVTVTEPSGAVVSGVPVVFQANAGRFKHSRIQTNANGQAIATLHSGYNTFKDLALSARVGLVRGVTEQAEIKPSSDTYSNTGETVIVGDETTGGYAEYERYDGARIGLRYKTDAQILVHGQPQQPLTLTLGSLAEPNIQPIAMYGMNELILNTAPEGNGIYDGQAVHVTVAEDDPTGTGSSYRFKRQAELNIADVWESSKVIVAFNANFKPKNSVGFRVDINASDVGGDVFTLEGGVQGLSILDDGRLQYHVYTTEGKFAVTSAPISLTHWHTVAGRYKNGVLALEVDGVNTQVSATGALSYTVSQRGLTLGEDFDGKLSSFKYYDWDREPLVTFEDGRTTTTLTLAAGQYQDAVKVVSKGQFNQQGEQAITLRIGLQTNDQLAFVGVISKAFYGQLAGMYAEGVQPPGYPPIAGNGVSYQQYQGVPFISMAHAGILDWAYDNAFDALVSTIGFLIPYEEGIGLVKQVYYLVSGDDDFDPMELTLNAIGVISFIPLAKPLLPVVKALKIFFRPLKGNSGKFIKAIGGVLGKVVDELFDKRFDTLMTILPFLVVAGEMAASEESRAGLMVMIKSISSSDDLLAWADYLSLPADGWDTDEIPSVIDEAGNTASVSSDNTYPWAGMPFMGTAYAAKKTIVRIDGAKLGKVFKEIAEDANGHVDFKSMIIFIKNVRKGLKNTNSKELRKLIFNKRLIAAGTALAARSGRNLLNFLKGNTSSRISPSIMIAVVWYLEKSMADGTLKDVDRILHSRIRGRYGNAFTSIFTKGSVSKPTRLTNQAHGGMHQLATIAKLHLAQQQGLTQTKLKAVEGERTVKFYVENRNGEIEEASKQTRNVDIIVETEPQKEQWIELKSYTHKRAFQVWKYASSGGGGSVGKEIIVDRVAKTRASDDGVQDGDIQSVELRWLFQKFNVKKSGLPEQRSYSKDEFGKGNNPQTVLGKLARLTSDKDGVILTSLKYAAISDNKSFETEINSIAKLDGISAWLIEYGKEFLFKDFPIENLKE